MNQFLLIPKSPITKGVTTISTTWPKVTFLVSIPTSFNIELKKSILEFNNRFGRKLLNTENLIFKTEDLEGGWFVVVYVEPEGVVAIREAKERENVIFNIVCDELLLGIFVVVLVVVCIGVAFVVPGFLPLYLLPKEQRGDIVSDVSKVF
ncbi:hypothetical protein LIER_09245 [Lithospermum erythrorhizon]|uniref:Uncharacterized protein n=1 Tax=Lithospermum erythrorhizon TaxID=34254 RepID=A0AAV3PJT0_LITER